MAITTLDGLIGANRQTVRFTKTASRVTAANINYTILDLAGSPGAGSLVVGNTTSGIVPTDSQLGIPSINNFGAGNIGYLAKVDFTNTVSSRLLIYDRLFSAGSFAFNANTTLTGQPSFVSRLPNANYNGLEIWMEAASAFTGNQTIQVNYTNELGVTGRTTGAIATGVAPGPARMLLLPLQAGDRGVQTIESVTSTVSTAGTFNIHIMRKLWAGRVIVANGGDVHDFTKTNLPIVYDTSCLYHIIQPDAGATGLPTIDIDIVDG